MSVDTSARVNPDALQAALPAGAAYSTAGGDLASAQSKTITFYGTDDATGQSALTIAAGQFADRAANQSTFQQKLTAALAANVADVAQDQTIQSGAATIAGTAGTFTLAQCTTFIKQLAQAASTQAGNDINTKKELQAVAYMILGKFDTTAGA